VTVLLTTHVLDEAEVCDRVGILHAGRLVGLGSPEELKRGVGGDVVTIAAAAPEILQDKLAERFGCRPVLVRGSLRLEMPRGHEFVRELVEAFPSEVRSVAFGRPTLEDVFIRLTGERLATAEEAA
jgi:ABC-2 type transport system ATP-binding protein